MVDRSPQTPLKRKLTDLTRQVGSGRRRATTTQFHRLLATDDPDAVATKLGYLREAEVFASLSVTEWTWLAESTTMVTCDRGRVFYTPDEPGEVVFLLKRGRVDLYRLAPDGRKLVVATLGDHTLFGEMSLIGQQMYGCFAEAAEDCLLCVLSRSDLQALIRRNPEVGLRLLADLGNRLQQREAELEAWRSRTCRPGSRGSSYARRTALARSSATATRTLPIAWGPTAKPSVRSSAGSGPTG
jgi:CRP-like cAMP-binding protein